MGKKRKDRTPKTACNVGGESCSTSNTLNSIPQWKYDVFLSFAGKDTRLNFTGHLYEAFIRSGITCFKDDEALQRGEDIDYLFQAIEDSLCAVVVISKNYAKSTWCLKEIKKILQCQKRVFPIFYNVDPADVRHQRKSFRKALAKHEEKFKENTTEVQSWRAALSKISNISGWVTSREKPEADLIKDLVKKVSAYLGENLPSYDDNLVGIESRIRDMEIMLEIWLDDKRGVGIWGMGGVGKTTLARVVYEKISFKFEVCCFIENVRSTLQKEGLVSLQEKLLCDLKIKDMEISDQYKGKKMIRKHLSNKKVLLVLDDVDNKSQLDNLAESPDWFGRGSRIIITTRNSHVITSCRVERIYEVKVMEKDESLRLFSNEAFKEDHPKEGYWELTNSVIEYAGGLPLALIILGSYLHTRNGAEWRDVLDRLKQFPNNDIVRVLQISYDGLNEEEKTIFLDIACFFRGWPKKECLKF